MKSHAVIQLENRLRNRPSSENGKSRKQQLAEAETVKKKNPKKGKKTDEPVEPVTPETPETTTE